MIAAAAAWGMSLWQEALLFGIISALSLPIGALLGQYFSPVSDHTVAAIVAFGAGALLFAVTVELYGHALHEVAHGTLGYTEMITTVCCALLGALMYLWLNKKMEAWVESQGEGEEEDDPASEPASATSASSKAQAKPKASPSDALRSRMDRLRSHASNVGMEAVREKRKAMSAQEAISMFLTKTTPEHHQMLKAVRGRKKRMLLAVGATHERPTYGTIESGADADETEEHKERRLQEGMRLAYAMFLGLVVDGIPESILLGFLAAENSLSLVLVLSLFVANFPEAFSSASLMKEAGVGIGKIVGMWSALCLITGVLAALACAGLLYFAGAAAASGEMPFHIAMVIAVVEGIAGGAMIACIAAVMLPEAFGRKHETNLLMDSGFLCTAGFLCAVLIKVLGGVVTSDHLKDHAEDADVTQHAAHFQPLTQDSHALHGFEASFYALSNFLLHTLQRFVGSVMGINY